MDVFRIKVRKMLESDLGVVSELAMLANPFAAKEDYYKHFVSELKENPDLSFVADCSTKVARYVQADIHDGEAVLEDIAVSREYQRRGIGTRLMDHELKALKQNGVKTITEDVHYRCASAIPFYYKHSFRITGFGQDFYGKGHDAIILKLVS